jgi:hypothetical protein
MTGLRTAFGISVGDIVRTSYGGGPYRVKAIRPPHYLSHSVGVIVIRTWSVISLVCTNAVKPDGHSYISDIRREGERWFTDQNSEVFVTPSSGPPLQLALFGEEDEEPPYAFQAGVDYRQHAWKCERCGVDFNEQVEYPHPALHCGRVAFKLLLMEPRPTPPEPSWSEFQMVLGFTGTPRDYYKCREAMT